MRADSGRFVAILMCISASADHPVSPLAFLSRFPISRGNIDLHANQAAEVSIINATPHMGVAIDANPDVGAAINITHHMDFVRGIFNKFPLWGSVSANQTVGVNTIDPTPHTGDANPSVEATPIDITRRVQNAVDSVRAIEVNTIDPTPHTGVAIDANPDVGAANINITRHMEFVRGIFNSLRAIDANTAVEATTTSITRRVDNAVDSVRAFFNRLSLSVRDAINAIPGAVEDTTADVNRRVGNVVDSVGAFFTTLARDAPDSVNGDSIFEVHTLDQTGMTGTHYARVDANTNPASSAVNENPSVSIFSFFNGH